MMKRILWLVLLLSSPLSWAEADTGVASPSAGSRQESEVRAAVDAWAAAWSARDIIAFLDNYDRSFEPEDGLGRIAWETRRKDAFRRAKSISVKVSDVFTVAQSGGRIDVYFAQEFHSGVTDAFDKKRLSWMNVNGRWKVVSEVTLNGQQFDSAKASSQRALAEVEVPKVAMVPPVQAVQAVQVVVESPPGATERRTDLSGYRLGAGDILNISVYGEDDMSRDKLRISDTGVISFPFGDLLVRGMTVGELEVRIADGLRGAFLVNPRVSVTIVEYRPFFIYGQVERPGSYPYLHGLNVRKAVSIAGGFRERASPSKIFVVREGDAANASSKVDLNSSVWPGDTITVEESFF
ncbi:polysaccharide biosynthesis/export family protein [Ferriphaselus sp. R-1]|uniref:polysaccharide biosynthesis/export family protein n=1 Tax=Ferriphaselus sp. R-1 TaxID=1485544 RepID=UPI001929C570|nr:polysaccharide biosynthesis/export family protein [Ferriphaselus sp. R-1]